MASYRRNILIGITVLGALIILGWMILKFGGKAAYLVAKARIPVTFVSDRSDGLDEGSAVLYRGVKVGLISRIRRAEDNEGVFIEASVDEEPPLPGNVQGVIRQAGLVGSGASMSIEVVKPGATTRPKPSGRLQKHQQIPAHFAGLDLLPPEFATLAEELRKTSEQFRTSNLVSDLDKAVLSTQAQLEKAGKLMDSLHEVVADKDLRSNLQQSLANLKTATENASRITAKLDTFTDKLDGVTVQVNTTFKSAQTTIDKTQGHIDELSKQLSARLEQVSKILDSFQSISTKIDKGTGTAGQLVNDPKLYESLVDTSRELNATVSDIKRLVEQWEQEGVSFKLNKK
ncbi:MAG TPA: MlaD family protein [Tepidisphaeraceae bacterium]|jgi:phospholipid/cholesterol/gamma-HCH transport system substrate-binding protein